MNLRLARISATAALARIGVLESSTFKKILIPFILLAGFTPPVTADEFAFSFESPFASATGVLTTSNTLNSLGNYDVTGIVGNITGGFGNMPIGTLLPNPNQPNVYDAPNGNVWDNNLLVSAPFVTPNGIGFNVDGDQLVLFSGVTGDPLSEGLFSENQNESAIGTLSVTPVPEPGSAALLLCGLLGVGLGLRTRGRALVVGACAVSAASALTK